MYIQWSDDWLINVHFVDEQHKEFVAMVNELHSAFVASKKAEMEKLAEELCDFAQIHFNTEEWFFRKFDYPGRYDHIKEHRVIANQLLHIVKDGKAYPHLYGDTFPIIKEWVTKHFIETDMKFAAFIKKVFEKRYKR